MEDLIIESQSSDEIPLFAVLPSDITDGTAYDYFERFPFMNEEIYFLLQCGTRDDMSRDACVKLCQEIVDERNKTVLENFGGGNIFECEVSLEEELNYADSNLSELLLCDKKTERHEEQ